MNEIRSHTDGSPSRNGSTEPAERARAEAHSAMERGGEMARDAKHEAQAAMGEARSRMSAAAEEQKGAVAAMISDVAEAVRSAAGQLGENQPGAAQYAEAIGSGLSRLSRALESTSAGDMVDEVSRFARNHPAAYLGGAVLIGMALARFTKASRPHGGPGVRQKDDADAFARS